VWPRIVKSFSAGHGWTTPRSIPARSDSCRPHTTLTLGAKIIRKCVAKCSLAKCPPLTKSSVSWVRSRNSSTSRQSHHHHDYHHDHGRDDGHEHDDEHKVERGRDDDNSTSSSQNPPLKCSGRLENANLLKLAGLTAWSSSRPLASRRWPRWSSWLRSLPSVMPVW